MPKRKSRLAPSLQTMSAHGISVANSNLEKLCAKYGFKPWAIDAARGHWRELVCAICGVNVPAKPIGRPTKYSSSEAIYIAEQVDFERDFGHISQSSNSGTKKITRKKAFENVADAINRERKVQAIKPGGVRKIYNRFEAGFRKRIQEHE
jgi:hypothetical protein